MRSRAYYRHQRRRYIARRRRAFNHWVSINYDSKMREHAGPRPLEVREKEFWNPRRVGRLAKWNGVCSCRSCRSVRKLFSRYRRSEEKRQSQMEIAEGMEELMLTGAHN